MIACFDIGGTLIKYGLIEKRSDSFHISHRHEISTDAKQIGGPGILQKIVSIVQNFQKSTLLEGVGISTAGMVDPDKGSILYANDNIPNYTGINWKEALETQCNLPCAVENDVNAAAIGEYAAGAGRGAQDILCLTVGTGVGGAVIINEKIFHGHSGSAGEIGYMLVEGQAFEKLASTSALVNRTQKRIKINPPADGRELFKRAQSGDIICQEEIEKNCDYLAQGLVNCACLFNPERIVLGGGVMQQETYLRPIIEKYMQKYLLPRIYNALDIRFAELGNDAGMIGAAQLFFNIDNVK